MSKMSTYRRPVFRTALDRLSERRRFLQVLAGPRQAGKTTLALQLLEAIGCPSHYASADGPMLEDRSWIEAQWEIGRLRAREAGRDGAVLVLDEVQKIGGWSDIVKRLWDEDTRAKRRLKVVLLGSAPLLVRRGLSESLAGRFEIVRVNHWSFAEMRDAFGWDLEQYVYFGGYPGAAPLIGDESRWSAYVRDALVETTISRDVLLMSRIDKPALLRRVFELACAYSGQVLSYQKMLGQLQDAGNTTTIAHYLELLAGAGMVMGLPKFAGQKVRQRGSSPKLQVLNTALMTAQAGRSFAGAREDAEYWGRLVESAVGAHLVNDTLGSDVEVSWWRERNREVDFVARRGRTVVAVEVKSGRRASALPGLDAFAETFKPKRTLIVGAQGIPLEEFLLTPVATWLK